MKTELRPELMDGIRPEVPLIMSNIRRSAESLPALATARSATGSAAAAAVEPRPLAPRAPLELSGGRRDDARLLVARDAGEHLSQARLADLADFLEPGDLVVVNTSATLPAAIEVDPGLVVHLSTLLATDQPERRQAPGQYVEATWVVELRHRTGHGSQPWLGYRPSAPISLPGGGVLEVLGPYAPYAPSGRAEPSGTTRLWRARLALPVGYDGLRDGAGRRRDHQTAAFGGVDAATLTYLSRHGRPIRYGPDAGPWPLSAYQTVFATEPGSAEMPSAARGFTPEVVTDLVSQGITVAPIVLHTGVASPEVHEPPYPERYRVPRATATAVNGARAAGRRVVAVGTTATRALETATRRNGAVTPSEGWTDLVITPERGVRAVNGLITGWHDPEASHLLLVEAVAGRELLDESYAAAVAAGFHGHEFGDFHLILP